MRYLAEQVAQGPVRIRTGVFRMNSGIPADEADAYRMLRGLLPQRMAGWRKVNVCGKDARGTVDTHIESGV